MSRDNIHVTVRGVIICEEHILMCKSSNYKDHYYFLPGGHIEHREYAQIALIRELEEEIGHRCEIERFLGVLEYVLPEDYPMCHNHGYTMVFKMKLPKDIDFNTKFAMVGENESLVWVRFSDYAGGDAQQDSSQLDSRVIHLFSILKEWIGKDYDEAIKRFF